MASNKKLRTEEPSLKVKSVTPKVATPASKVTPKTNLSGMKKKTTRVTPMRSGVKKSTPGPKDPLSAVKKPLKRLTKAAAVTPAQVQIRLFRRIFLSSDRGALVARMHRYNQINSSNNQLFSSDFHSAHITIVAPNNYYMTSHRSSQKM